MSEAKPAVQVKVKITRKDGHKHGGTHYKCDAEIEVPAHDSTYIVEHKIGELVKGSK